MTFSGKPLPVFGMASVQYNQPFLAGNKAITDNKVFCISMKFCNLAVLLTIVWIHLPTHKMQSRTVVSRLFVLKYKHFLKRPTEVFLFSHKLTFVDLRANKL